MKSLTCNPDGINLELAAPSCISCRYGYILSVGNPEASVVFEVDWLAPKI